MRRQLFNLRHHFSGDTRIDSNRLFQRFDYVIEYFIVLSQLLSPAEFGVKLRAHATHASRARECVRRSFRAFPRTSNLPHASAERPRAVPAATAPKPS